MEDPDSILQSSPENFESRKEEAYIKLAKYIVGMYNASLRSQVITKIIKRSQFRYLLTILECYEMLQIYCNLSQKRKKEITVKTQAIKLIVKHSKLGIDQAPLIHANTVSKLIKGAVRVKRLLKLAQNNFNIIDAFPDLQVNFFTGTGLNAANFERWLILVEKNVIISVKEGENLYKEYKALAKNRRSKNLNKKNKIVAN